MTCNFCYKNFEKVQYSQKFCSKICRVTAGKPRYSILNQVRNYGLTEAEAEQILKITYCEICGLSSGESKQKIGTDHCHETGVVRGRLCDNHNRALGMFNDDIELLQSAIDYLNKGFIFDE